MKLFFSGTLLNVCKENVLTKWPEKFSSIAEISNEEVDGCYYRPLLRAAFKGDWESAKRFLEIDPASKTAKITSRSETVLHIAALNAQDQFVENLIEVLFQYPEALEMVDCDGRTALHIAVLCGRIRLVKALVRSNPKLTQLPDNEGRLPLDISAREACMHKEIAWFLAKYTTDDGPSHPFSSPYAIRTIIGLAFAGHYDIILHLVQRYPHFLTMKGGSYGDLSIMGMLARNESHFPSGTRLTILEALIYTCTSVDLNYKPIDESSEDPPLQCLRRSLWNAAKIVVPTIKRIHEVKLRHVASVELAKQVCIAISHMTTPEITKFFEEEELLARAISRGIPELVKLWIEFFPELMQLRADGETLRTIAVEYRQESILRLFLKGSSTNELSFIPAPTPSESWMIMVAATKYKPNLGGVNKVSGAAFKMQKELQWFKAMEMCIMPDVRTAINNGKTCWELFMEKHEQLLKDGEKWVKETANSCMLVSTLIATVLFAAAFTVPGGNNGNTGVPLLLGEDSLLVFAISDALGLFSSVMAIMLFLAILTSHYEWEDFLHSLPKKIIMGLSFLILSLAFMLVAFAATLTIVLDKRLEWVFIPITLLASLTVFLFLGLQLPLLFRMVKSTYGPSIFRPTGHSEVRHNN
ncbi:uncharacterized protein LOC115688193 [Syzygium oleosum]|uniref:uncharacterized protein LOC115688193 n=1 Tax=Syzygium oleosum TaxID=219896 RepID=UPI0024BAD9D7|nr:uncharacterized protein LOC115688193 [Syzygium oleosum]